MRAAGAAGGGPRGGLSRAGCGAAAAVMAAFLVGGFLALDRGVDWLVVRACDRVEASLPADLDPATRRRLLAGLDDFVDSLPGAPDRDAATGTFLSRVGAALEDRSLTADEAVELADYLEATCAGWRTRGADGSAVPAKR